MLRLEGCLAWSPSGVHLSHRSRYADDLVILDKDETRLELETLGEHAMSLVQAWSNQVGVDVANKTRLR